MVFNANIHWWINVASYSIYWFMVYTSYARYLRDIISLYIQTENGHMKINATNVLKYLGLHIDSHLQWKYHGASIVKKLRIMTAVKRTNILFYQYCSKYNIIIFITYWIQPTTGKSQKFNIEQKFWINRAIDYSSFHFQICTFYFVLIFILFSMCFFKYFHYHY